LGGARTFLRSPGLSPEALAGLRSTSSHRSPRESENLDHQPTPQWAKLRALHSGTTTTSGTPSGKGQARARRSACPRKISGRRQKLTCRLRVGVSQAPTTADPHALGGHGRIPVRSRRERPQRGWPHKEAQQPLRFERSLEQSRRRQAFASMETELAGKTTKQGDEERREIERPSEVRSRPGRQPCRGAGQKLEHGAHLPQAEISVGARRPGEPRSREATGSRGDGGGGGHVTWREACKSGGRTSVAAARGV
jgi:hypothetical protein